MYFLCNTFVHDDTLILAYFKEVKTHTNKKALMGKKHIYASLFQESIYVPDCYTLCFCYHQFMLYRRNCNRPS